MSRAQSAGPEGRVAVASLSELFVCVVKDVYNAESQLLQLYPRLLSVAASDGLRAELARQLTETRSQLNRLEALFAQCASSPLGQWCEGMSGLVTEARSFALLAAPPRVLDAAVIAVARRLKHYEIGVYSSLVLHARAVDSRDVHAVLSAILDEETEADARLVQLASATHIPQQYH